MSRGWLPWTRQVGRSRAHWLGDQWRGWLDATEHAWWRRGILASLRTDHRTSGAGREERLVADIEKLSEEFWGEGAQSSSSLFEEKDIMVVACRLVRDLLDRDRLVEPLAESAKESSQHGGEAHATRSVMKEQPVGCLFR